MESLKNKPCRETRQGCSSQSSRKTRDTNGKLLNSVEKSPSQSLEQSIFINLDTLTNINQENKKNQENQENKKNQENQENQENQNIHENHENQKNQVNQENQEKQEHQENHGNQKNQKNQMSQKNYENHKNQEIQKISEIQDSLEKMKSPEHLEEKRGINEFTSQPFSHQPNPNSSVEDKNIVYSDLVKTIHFNPSLNKTLSKPRYPDRRRKRKQIQLTSGFERTGKTRFSLIKKDNNIDFYFSQISVLQGVPINLGIDRDRLYK